MTARNEVIEEGETLLKVIQKSSEGNLVCEYPKNSIKGFWKTLLSFFDSDYFGDIKTANHERFKEGDMVKVIVKLEKVENKTA